MKRDTLNQINQPMNNTNISRPNSHKIEYLIYMVKIVMLRTLIKCTYFYKPKLSSISGMLRYGKTMMPTDI